MRQLDNENEILVEELFTRYDQLNAAFAVTDAVDRCRTAQQVVRVLADEIAQAVDSRFSYYFGPLAAGFPLSKKNDVVGQNVITSTRNAGDKQTALNFLTHNQHTLGQMANAQIDSHVRMIDYHRTYNPDHEGRGNVLAVRLTGNDPQVGYLGTLIFVRSDAQEPFAGSQMNLSVSLGKMGSSVLSNIIYVQKLNESYLQVIASLVRAMEARDEYTSGHSSRVAEIACELARYVGLDDEQVQVLEWTGQLHDIGKIGIRDDVLSKPGRLTDEEFDHIKTHPVKSYNILEPIDSLGCVLDGVRHHHEHYDGSGYPDGLTGEKIPFTARILQIADVWDAITSTRSYRQAMPPEKALQIMRSEAGTILDPNLVQSFLKMMEEQKIT